MYNQAIPYKQKKKYFTFRLIFVAALISGTLDGSAAILNTYLKFGRGPVAVFKFIASGVLGSSAFSGGAIVVFAGIIFHYFIALIWTLLFFFIYPKLKISAAHKIISGLIYGVLIWLVMNLIVLPLSNTPPIKFQIWDTVLGISFIMFLVGLPISIIYHKYNKKV